MRQRWQTCHDLHPDARRISVRSVTGLLPRTSCGAALVTLLCDELAWSRRAPRCRLGVEGWGGVVSAAPRTSSIAGFSWLDHCTTCCICAPPGFSPPLYPSAQFQVSGFKFPAANPHMAFPFLRTVSPNGFAPTSPSRKAKSEQRKAFFLPLSPLGRRIYL